MHKRELGFVISLICVSFAQIGICDYTKECLNETVIFDNSCKATPDKSFADNLKEQLEENVEPILIEVNVSLQRVSDFTSMECGLVLGEFAEQLLDLKSQLGFLVFNLAHVNEHVFYMSFTMVDSPQGCMVNISNSVIRSKLRGWTACLIEKHNEDSPSSMKINKLCFLQENSRRTFKNPFLLYPDYYSYDCCMGPDKCSAGPFLEPGEVPWLEIFSGSLNYGASIVISFLSIIVLCTSMDKKLDRIRYRPQVAIKRIWEDQSGNERTTDIPEINVDQKRSSLLLCTSFTVRHLIQLAFDLDRYAKIINILMLVVYITIALIFDVLLPDVHVCILSFGDLIISIFFFLLLALIYFVIRGRALLMSKYTVNKGTICYFFQMNMIIIILFRNAMVMLVAVVLESTPNMYTLVASITIALFINGYCVIRAVHQKYFKFLVLCLETITINLHDNTSPTLLTCSKHLVTYSVEDDLTSRIEQDAFDNFTLKIEQQVCLFLLDNGEPAIPKPLFRKLCECKAFPSPGRLARSLYTAAATFVIVTIISVLMCSVVNQFAKFDYNSFTNHFWVVVAGTLPSIFRSFLPFMSNDQVILENKVNFTKMVKLVVQDNREEYTIGTLNDFEAMQELQDYEQNTSEESRRIM